FIFMRRNKYTILLFILTGYSFLFIATSVDKEIICDSDCEKIYNLNQALINGRSSYIYGVSRCTRTNPSDTICVFVKDTIGINWNLLADTACILATQQGLLQQKIFILKNSQYPPDTVSRKQCP
ncbi:MAG TPA: hypothetical protein VN451_01785, partial [Chitinophagaceae bacterium]|nr:hypothetical protein [Chitinophagaceae bacterium]